MCCASGLWPSNLEDGINNKTELEALCRALCVFRP